MITVTGQLQDARGNPVHARVTFKSKSFPVVASGIVTGKTTVTLKTRAADGSFAVALAPGNYDVTYQTSPDQTSFAITVPDGTSSIPIDQLTTVPLSFGAASGQVRIYSNQLQIQSPDNNKWYTVSVRIFGGTPTLTVEGDGM